MVKVAKTPETKAADLSVGTVRKGRTGHDYEVFEDSVSGSIRVWARVLRGAWGGWWGQRAARAGEEGRIGVEGRRGERSEPGGQRRPLPCPRRPASRSGSR